MTKNQKILLISSPFIVLATIANSIVESIKDLKKRWEYFDDDNGKVQCKGTCDKEGPIYLENQYFICSDCFPRN